MKHGSILGGSLLVAGTAIGGGMLALPVLTSLGGFVPSIFIYLACWLFMCLTGLLFLEIALHMEAGANIVTMAERTFGVPGKIAAWGLYLFLFYCLTLAYIIGCGDIFSSLSQGLIPRWLGSCVFLVLFAPFVYAGAKVVGKLNYFLMGGLLISFLAFVVIGMPEVKLINLQHRDFGLSLLALPIAFISFAYQGIIPTLVSFLDRDPKKARTCIWIGTLIPLATYIIWQWLILGIIPLAGEGGLKMAFEEGRNAVYPLKYHLNHPYIFIIGEFFAFFALVTSFFGVTLGLFDFLRDGLKLNKTTQEKLFLLALIFIPPLLISFFRPDVFLLALDYAGGYGASLLLGLLPILMAAKLRSRHPEYTPQVGGGNVVLILLALFVIFELVIEIIK
jgi:tyrosine-specific transport protein